MKFKIFSINEFIAVFVILFVIISLSLLNFRVSLRKARDAQRRADINAIDDALYKFQAEFGFFPPSVEGKILACPKDNINEYIDKLKTAKTFDQSVFNTYLRTCEWGVDALKNILTQSPVYIKKLPVDPSATGGFSYLYLADNSRFQLYASMEGGSSEEGYRSGIVDRALKCGEFICNFGKASGETPLEKSIEEYENELLQLELQKQKQLKK